MRLLSFMLSEELSFLFYLTLINLKCNSNNDPGLVAAIFDNIVIDDSHGTESILKRIPSTIAFGGIWYESV